MLVSRYSHAERAIFLRRTIYGVLAFIGLGLAIQLVPYGRSHENPRVSSEPEWDRPETRELFFRACGDCHSNETVWPWYSQIAPVSWLVQHDVDEGRSHFNVSEWGRPENHGDDAADLVRESEMPPWFYLPAHPEARLSEADEASLINGLLATFPEDENGHHGDGHDHDR